MTESLLKKMDQNDIPPGAIAIVGMACRFPGANNVDEFWELLSQGDEAIRNLGEAELNEAGVSRRDRRNPDYVKRAAPIDDMEGFDAEFFGFSPRDAAIMDPQHRHFLECSWEALEHSGYNPYSYDGAIGLFAGCGMQTYFTRNLSTNKQLMSDPGLFLVRHTGNDKDFFATRVSYQFNLQGPAMSVQTACSTSLVAVHQACQSLLSGESDMALAGGATVVLPHRAGYVYEEGGILSHDGHCRAFDATSTGTVFGSGVGAVVLRRLEDAINDGDEIHAVILGSAINNDGSEKVSYLAPSVEGQAAAIAEALEVSGVDASTISYVESHGTGTQIGDPIEVAALTKAYRETTSDIGFCGLGSVKSNVGHLDAAAGVASLIKAALALKHRELPATLHFKEINPGIEMESSPFFVVGEHRPWTLPEEIPVRRAGVNSLGVGGTNAHVILEEAPELSSSTQSDRGEVLLFSAHSKRSLNRITKRITTYLKKNPKANLSDVAFTLQVGRHSFRHRKIVAVADVQDAVEVLEKGSHLRIFSGLAEEEKKEVVFMFPGQGSQYVDMGRDLYEQQPVFRDAMDQGFRLLDEKWNIDLRPAIYPDSEQAEKAEEVLKTPISTNLSIFLVEYSLTQLWLSHGIRPTALIGHSLGEYALACAAGILSFEDALRLVVARCRIFEKLPGGAMLAVSLSETEMQPFLGNELSIAAINDAGMTVVSGALDDIEELKRDLSEKEIESRELKIPVAAHSHLVDPFLEEFRREAEKVTYRSPTVPCVSNLTGGFVSDEAWTNPDYWVDHLRNPVRFADGFESLVEKHPNALLLEVGPAQNLCQLGKQNQPEALTVPSMRKPRDMGDDWLIFLSALGRLWNAGFAVDWQELHAEKSRRRVALPTYPFDHRRFWIEETPSSGDTGPEEPEWGRADDVSECFSKIAWVEDPSPPQEKIASRCFVLISENEQTMQELELGIRTAVDRKVEIIHLSREDFDFSSQEDCRRLVTDLKNQNDPEMCLIYDPGIPEYANATIGVGVEKSFHHLVNFFQELAMENAAADWHLRIILERGFSVAGECLPNPLASLITGACRVMSREVESFDCKIIDAGEGSRRRDWNLLGKEIVRVDPEEKEICLRGGQRWKAVARPDLLSREKKAASLLRKDGVYLITGGTGGLGFELARHLTESKHAKVVLVSRNQRKIKGNSTDMIQIQADVSKRNELDQAITTAESQFGKIDGVFHCAGTVADAPFLTKSKQSLDSVLRPKVMGAANLVDLFAERKPDFMVFYSSVSGWLGSVGQIDYAASCLFLDALAQRCDAEHSFPVSSIAWGPWKEVGMAARMLEGNRSKQKAHHPLLAEKEVDGDTLKFSGKLEAKDNWMLDGHRTQAGISLLPGTAYLELVRSAIDTGSDKLLKISDIVFLSPLVVEGATEISLEYERSTGDFAIRSRALLDTGTSSWIEHSSGKAETVAIGKAPDRKIADLLASCPDSHETFSIGEAVSRQEKMLRFGERWSVLEEAWYGTNCSLGKLSLAEKFREDLDETPLHPAMLDIATGFALPLITGYREADSYYVPVSYEQIIIHGNLQPTIYSFIQCQDPSNRDSVLFDILILDEQGNVLVEIAQFRMTRLGSPNLALQQDRTLAPGPVSDRVDELDPGQIISRGFLNSEGREALDLLLTEDMPATVMVSPFDPQTWKNRLDHSVMPGGESEKDQEDDQPGTLLLERPNLSIEYSEPRGEAEEKIAAIWKESLGISTVGRDDNFYELGGHSLALVQIIIRTRKELNVNIPVGDPDLFDNPTIREMAKFADEKEHKSPPKKPVAIRKLSRKEFLISRTELK